MGSPCADLSMEHVKSEGRISSEQLENQEDATSESLSTHDQLDAESSHITGKMLLICPGSLLGCCLSVLHHHMNRITRNATLIVPAFQ